MNTNSTGTGMDTALELLLETSRKNKFEIPDEAFQELLQILSVAEDFSNEKVQENISKIIEKYCQI
jgi:hypothetical protein